MKNDLVQILVLPRNLFLQTLVINRSTGAICAPILPQNMNGYIAHFQIAMLCQH